MIGRLRGIIDAECTVSQFRISLCPLLDQKSTYQNLTQKFRILACCHQLSHITRRNSASRSVWFFEILCLTSSNIE
jgi:hypothetical protein